ncbi:MAG: C69 family dipeptidase [Bacteroidales bacterium]|nr:C69 family dipeptidase [Bacteroidales bacterium]
MKKIALFISVLAMAVAVYAQDIPPQFEGLNCTSIMVGKNASKDGSVITSHTCDGVYRTWMAIEPAKDYGSEEVENIYKGTVHTSYRSDTTGVRLAGTIPQVGHTYAYLNTAYPCMNEKQLAIGETTFSGPKCLVNKDGMFQIEELMRIVLKRCDNARDAIRLIGSLIKQYGYGDEGECITIADKHEVWQMEILGEGPKRIGGVWAAQRIPDDHVGVSANIPRIGRMNRANTEYFMASDNVEKVAKEFKLWDGKSEFVFWKAFNADYAQGKNFREREFFIFNALAPSLHLSMDMDELPFSVRPDSHVDVRKVMELFRSTYEGTDMDMCKNLKCIKVDKKDKNKKDTVESPIANPWMTSTTMNTYNAMSDGAVDFKRTVAVAWCSYSTVIQLRDWLPNEIGGVCWLAFDNPGQSPRIPIFCGNTLLPTTFSVCGQNFYSDNAAIWKYRRANKLATIAWQRTKGDFNKTLKQQEDYAFSKMLALEKQVTKYIESRDNAQYATDRDAYHNQAISSLNDYTMKIYDASASAWKEMEENLWFMFRTGF